MKKLFLILAISVLPFMLSSQTLTGTVIADDTITSDTRYALNTTDSYFWGLQVLTKGVTSNDTAYAKIQISYDGGTTWFDYANMDSVQLTAAQPNRAFRDVAGNEGVKLAMYLNLGVKDTVIVDEIRYVLRPKTSK